MLFLDALILKPPSLRLFPAPPSFYSYINKLSFSLLFALCFGALIHKYNSLRLATKPVVTAVHGYATKYQPDSKLLFGMDANTYASPEKDQQGVTDFAKFYTGLKLNSCYGPTPNPINFTTFHARTHLQTQLNKVLFGHEQVTWPASCLEQRIIKMIIAICIRTIEII